MNNDDQQWWYFLVSAIDLLSTIGSFLLALRSWCSLIGGGGKCWQRYYAYLESAVAASIIGSSFRMNWSCWKTNDDDCQRRHYLRCVIAVVSAMSSFLLALSWSWHYIHDDNQQLWHYWRSTIAVILPTVGYPCFLHLLSLENFQDNKKPVAVLWDIHNRCNLYA